MDPLNNQFNSHRAGPFRQHETLPASQYLQQRLQERRVRKPSRASDIGPRRGRDDDIFLDEAEASKHEDVRLHDSSPHGLLARSGLVATSGGRSRRTVSARELDEQMDGLHKQNFALKLELDHRRDRTTKLEEHLEGMRIQVERAEKLEVEHTELLKINSQLIEELEKRDKAVEEAMDIICDLEEKVFVLEEDSTQTRPSTAQADSGYASTETHETVPSSSPQQRIRMPTTRKVGMTSPPSAASVASNKLMNVTESLTPGRPSRIPSFISQQQPTTQALRSVYLGPAKALHSVQSFNSLISKRDSRTEDGSIADEVLNSPRLSLLSESSFPSIYSPKKVSPDKYAWEADDEDDAPLPSASPRSHQRDSIHRVSQWIAEGDEPGTPSKTNHISSPLSHHTDIGMPKPSRNEMHQDHYQSLDDALSNASTPVAGDMLRSGFRVQQGLGIQQELARTRADKQIIKTRPRTPNMGGPMFGEPLLPPKPESTSTMMPRASRSSIVADKTLLDATPAAVDRYNDLESGVRTAPKQFRPSIELNHAYDSNVLHRAAAQVYGIRDEGSSDSDSECNDANSTIRDFGLEYDGYPDGNSIIMGTPSRFLKHTASPSANMLFDGNEGPQSARPEPRRRQTSTEMQVSTRKPSLSRAETSPTIISSFGHLAVSGAPTWPTEASLSPRSQGSGSSSNRTVMEDRYRSMSPEVVRSQPRLAALGRSDSKRSSPSPAPTTRSSFTEKTQKLFRRLSNSHADNKPALPTLTTTPSTAYVNDVHKPTRRPSTATSSEMTQGRRSSRDFATLPQSRYSPTPKLRSREERRPSLQHRSQTTPSQLQPASSAMPPAPTVAEKEGRSYPFQRSSSVKKSTTATPNQQSEAAGKESSGVGRRGSIRDAVSAGRRPWR